MYTSKEKNKEIIANIKRDISIVDYASRLGFTPKRVGSYYTLKEHDSVRIDPAKNIFYRNQNGAHGDIIDFMIEFEPGINNFHDAMKALDSDRYSQDYAPKNKPIQPSYTAPSHTKHFVLPERDDNVKNVYAYLINSRKIHKDIVSKLVGSGYIKQDKHKNCMFIGYDNAKDKNPVFTSLRGTHTKKTFKADVPGSDYSKCFYIDNSSSRLFVTEAPIDALSIMSQLKQKGHDPFKYNYLAMSGVNKTDSLFSRLNDNCGIRRVVLCLDNDYAGQSAASNILKQIKENHPDINASICKPTGKDFNDDLIAGVISTDLSNLFMPKVPLNIPFTNNEFTLTNAASVKDCEYER